MPPTEKQARTIWFALTALSVGVLLGLLGLLIWGLALVLDLLSPVLWPLAIAGVIAYLLDPLVDRLERKGVARTRAILSVFALAMLILLGLASSVVPQLVIETRHLAVTIPDHVITLQGKVEGWVNNPLGPLGKLLGRKAVTPGATNEVHGTNILAPLPSTNAPSSTTPTTPGATNEVHGTNIFAPPPSTNAPSSTTPTLTAPSLLDRALAKENLQTATAWLAKVMPRLGSWLFGQVTRVASWFGVLAGLALIPVYAFYFLLEKRGIESKWTDYLPVIKSDFKTELVFVLKSINNYLIVFFRSQVLVAICDGVLYTIGFLLIGLPYAVLLGVMAVVLTMIPFLGAIVTCLAALVLSLVQYGDWQHPALVLVVFAVVQTLEGLVIAPKIMGDRVGLHPLTIIIAVMVGTTLLGGLLGGVLAIPFTAALRVVMFRYVWKRRER